MDDRPVALSLFAGIGGVDLALERAGFCPAGQVELDGFCRRILAERFPDARRWRDVRRFRGTQAGRLARAVWEFRADGPDADGREPSGGPEGVGLRAQWREPMGRRAPVDLLTGGFPCQDLSVAGQRRGLAGRRSGLFYEIVRIAKILRPPWGLFENVPGLLSSAGGRDMGLVLAGLRKCWPAVGYRVLDSRYFGVPQRRRRVFFVCGPDEARVASVLFEPEGGDGDLAPGREAGARVAASLSRGTGPTSSGGRRREDDVNLVVVSSSGQGYWRDGPGTCTARDYRDGHHAGLVVDGQNAAVVEDVGALSTGAAHGNRGFMAMTVRRLTPTECARLQDFPDGWACLCQPLAEWARDPETAAERCRCPDGPQYRGYGNAVTVSVVEWLARRLMAAMDGNATPWPAQE